MPLLSNPANGASTDNVNHGTLGGVAWSSVTIGGWWLPKTVTANNRALFSKGASAAPRMSFRQSNAGVGAVTAVWTSNTVVANYGSTANGIVTAGVPLFLFLTADVAAGAGQVFHVYTGTLSSPLASVPMSVVTEMSGIPDTLTTAPFRVSASETPDIAFCGEVFHAFVFANRVLTLEQMETCRIFHRGLHLDPTLACRYGANGRGLVIDESGNGYHGTITGAIPTNSYLPRVSQRWQAA